MLGRAAAAARCMLHPARRTASCATVGRRCIASESGSTAATSSAPAAARGSTVDDAEVRKFSQLAGQWWSGVGGAFEGLHSLNRVRVPIIVSAANAARPAPAAVQPAGKPLAGLSIVDIGCGGGILAQPMARLGGQVLGIDAAAANVAAASLAASQDASLASSLSFECVTAEELAARGRTFDVVVSSEVIEHVADVDAFCRAACALVKPGGTLMMTTMNRTVASFALAILGAEYVARIVPPGTHEWAKFVTPDELQFYLRKYGVVRTHITGMRYNPVTGLWSETCDTSVNYALAARKPLE